jgi:Tfp pilus assembly protein FimV
MPAKGEVHSVKSEGTFRSLTSHRSPLVMQVTSTTSSPTSSFGSTVSSNSASNGAPSFQSLLSQLTDYTKETPAQRMEAAALAQLGITPQQLQSMSPQERAQVEAKVEDLVKKEMQAQQQQVQQQQQQAQAQTQVQAHQPASESKTHSSSGREALINLAI